MVTSGHGALWSQAGTRCRTRSRVTLQLAQPWPQGPPGAPGIAGPGEVSGVPGCATHPPQTGPAGPGAPLQVTVASPSGAGCHHRVQDADPGAGDCLGTASWWAPCSQCKMGPAVASCRPVTLGWDSEDLGTCTSGKQLAPALPSCLLHGLMMMPWASPGQGLGRAPAGKGAGPRTQPCGHQGATLMGASAQLPPSLAGRPFHCTMLIRGCW